MMTKEKLKELVETVEANYTTKVTVWGNLPDDIFIECKGFIGPSKKIEKLIKKLNLKITEQSWADGSDYTGYYYWVNT